MKNWGAYIKISKSGIFSGAFWETSLRNCIFLVKILLQSTNRHCHQISDEIMLKIHIWHIRMWPETTLESAFKDHRKFPSQPADFWLLKNCRRRHAHRHMLDMPWWILGHLYIVSPFACHSMSPVTALFVSHHIRYHISTESHRVRHHTNDVSVCSCPSCPCHLYFVSLRVLLHITSMSFHWVSCRILEIAQLCPVDSRVTRRMYPVVSSVTPLSCPPFRVHCVPLLTL